MGKDVEKSVRIAVTGTIGSGKSQAGGIAEALGAFVVDTDFLAKELQADGAEGAKQIKAVFGSRYYEGGILNRKALGREVFSNPESLARLNAIMHPLIYGSMLKSFEYAEKAGYPVICALVPLLFESDRKWLDCFDEVWLVAASEETCTGRITARDKCTVAEAKARIDAQMPLSKKLEAAAELNIPVTIIENDNGEPKLIKQVTKALKPYKKLLQARLKI